nr:immunoglobulin light chain junction region [Macaca mulatta]MPN87926.1 immunoglobulin light chain junction region [Macaca mulatta]MPN88021.1 immunoglobulin light chain junction region [Macaca mulatta]MPN89900.1 immunoglobulin light chain junction region [Macaca mulatta]MPN90086.1 immunoglobulin light chain junction region [Macaca mulatta]
YMQALQTPYSF